MSAKKLTALQADEIRKRHALGEKQRVLAAEYGVSISTISLVVCGHTWKKAEA